MNIESTKWQIVSKLGSLFITNKQTKETRIVDAPHVNAQMLAYMAESEFDQELATVFANATSNPPRNIRS